MALSASEARGYVLEVRLQREHAFIEQVDRLFESRQRDFDTRDPCVELD